MNWYSFAPKSWKWRTWNTLVRRARINYSTEKHLKEELNHIRKTYNEINNYPHLVITKVFKKFKEVTPKIEDKNRSITNRFLDLPYKGEKGINIVDSIKICANKVLTEHVKVQTAFPGKWLSISFKTKDRSKFEHQHDIIYQEKCSAENCSNDYIGVSLRHTIERVKDHAEEIPNRMF